jgi:hypothetical protein
LRESDQKKAERLMAQMLSQKAWTETELGKRKKGEREQVAMAARLRRETTMSWGWIAKRLEMGHWRTASNAVRCAP